MQSAVLLLCVLGLTEAVPLAQAPPPSSTPYTLLVPVTLLGSYGPQVVLVPVGSVDWTAQRSQSPTTAEQRHTHTSRQQQVKNEVQNENQALTQAQTLPSASPDTHTPPDTPETLQPQGQLLPVWNTFPGVTGQAVFPSWMPAAGRAGGQIQVVTVMRPGGLSDSESSEEGDTNQVIYLLPISDEIINMGLVEGGEGGVTHPEPEGLQPNPNPEPNSNPNPNPNPDPNLDLGYLQNPTPSPTTPAHLQQTPAHLDRTPPAGRPAHKPSAGVRQRTAGGGRGATTPPIKPCAQRGDIGRGKKGQRPV